MKQAVRMPGRQRGVVLFLALIVLVAMFLSGIALFRTADSGVFAAGNLALQRSAVTQADRGIEAASAWLAANAGSVVLHENPAESGYVDTPFYIANALNDQPVAGQGWLAWWNGYLATHTPAVLAQDPNSGHVVAYLIQRLCAANGDSLNAGCVNSPESKTDGNSQTSGAGGYEVPGPVFYRIIVRVDGPRNTTAFVQAVVSL